MVKKAINILIFLFIFSLYFVSFLLIYDTFRERKLKQLETGALDTFDKQVKVKEVKNEEPVNTYDEDLCYGNCRKGRNTKDRFYFSNY